MANSILIAAGDLQEGEKVKKALQKNGYRRIQVVDNAYSALRILRVEESVLSIIDTELSGMNGYNLSLIIAEEELGAAIIYGAPQKLNEQFPPSVFATLTRPFSTYQLLSMLRVVEVQYEQQNKLRQEISELKDNLESRIILEKAKGILMKNRNLSEEEAYQQLRRRSMEKRISLKKVAEAVILADEI